MANALNAPTRRGDTHNTPLTPRQTRPDQTRPDPNKHPPPLPSFPFLLLLLSPSVPVPWVAQQRRALPLPFLPPQTLPPSSLDVDLGPGPSKSSVPVPARHTTPTRGGGRSPVPVRGLGARLLRVIQSLRFILCQGQGTDRQEGRGSPVHSATGGVGKGTGTTPTPFEFASGGGSGSRVGAVDECSLMRASSRRRRAVRVSHSLRATPANRDQLGSRQCLRFYKPAARIRATRAAQIRRSDPLPRSTR